MRFSWLWDLLFLLGLAGVTYGLWQVSEPLAWIVPGLVLMALGAKGSMNVSSR